MILNLQDDSDLRLIYGNSLNHQMLIRLRTHLQTFELANRDIPISFELVNKYFSAFYDKRKKPVFIAGAIDKDKNNKPFPTIRFDKNNVALKLVEEFWFEYGKNEVEQKSNRICVKLQEETIDHLHNLLWSQLQWFTNTYFKKRVK